MPSWNNPDLAVLHGTDAVSLRLARADVGIRLEDFRIDLDRCRTGTDFGRGFYTTTSLRQASDWANRKVRYRRNARGNFAVVLKFQLSRDWLASLDSLIFIRPDEDYWSFVRYCRFGGEPHARSSRQGSRYDMVWGPVAAWPSQLQYQDCDQISFHTPKAIEPLQAEVLALSWPAPAF